MKRVRFSPQNFLGINKHKLKNGLYVHSMMVGNREYMPVFSKGRWRAHRSYDELGVFGLPCTTSIEMLLPDAKPGELYKMNIDRFDDEPNKFTLEFVLVRKAKQ